ncbi:MAG: insulinase family protein, partial [Acidobacteriota bacterium]
MITRRRSQLAVLVASLVTSAGLVLSGQTAARQPATTSTSPSTSPQPAPLSATIPVDPQVTTGRFANGLRYYIRANKRPEDRAELRLVVNAGSILEEDDQRGLAHFVEHMAFNGTRNFPKQDIVSFIESIGMKFGADLNASTSFDETVYKLQVPTDKPEVLDKAMLILEDWAHNVTFDPVEIDKERGVIIEEWRLGRGAAARMWDKQAPVLFQNSRYATRLPIGTVDILQHFAPTRLTQFYKDWYRPDLMAVIAVGDFDKPAMQALIQKHFSSIPAPAASARPRTNAPVPGHPGTTYAIATDAEARTTSVSVYNTMPVREQSTIGAYRRQIVESLYAGMLSARLSEIAQKPNAPFLGAGVQRGLLVRSSEVSFVQAAVKDGGVEQGLAAVFAETERVARFGFTATELARQKTNTLRSMERAVAEKDRQESSNLVAEYGRNFTDREPIPGIVYEQSLYQRFLPGVTLAEINALAKTWSPDRNRVVLVNAPQKDGVPVPTAATLAAVLATAATDLKPYEDMTDAQPLLSTLPAPGTIVKTATREAYGITEWTLSNGVTVVLKPTDFKQDEVLFRAVSLGGTSLASDQDFIAADTADQVVAAGGLGAFNSIDLRKVLTGKVASASPAFSDTDSSLSGGGSAKDLETIFQLIYMRFTQARPDPVIFGVLTDQLRAQLANQSAQPEFAFEQAMNAALTQDHPRARLMTSELLDQMNLDKSLAFYKDRFADASGFTFVFVGSFDVAAMKPLVEQYLAALPATHRGETWKDDGIRPPAGIVERRVEKGLEPKSQTRIVFSGPFQYDQAHRSVMRAMTTVLTNRLRDILREDLGGTYSVGASAGYSKIPRSEYRVTISFGSDPQRADALAQRLFQEIEQFKAAPPSPQAVNDVKETFLRDLETSNKQ